MGPPMTRFEVEEISTADAPDCDEIYDDVMPPGFKQDGLTVDESDYLIPEVGEEGVSSRKPLIELRATCKGYASQCLAPTTGNDQYFTSTNNEYSSVDYESHLSEEERDELGVYDDVGLPPGEERVNSLYAGSTPGSVLGLTSLNGKESEWEDLEEVSSASRCPCQTNDPW